MYRLFFQVVTDIWIGSVDDIGVLENFPEVSIKIPEGPHYRMVGISAIENTYPEFNETLIDT
jgi:hypothetical protein